jgi:hypothetical protein
MNNTIKLGYILEFLGLMTVLYEIYDYFFDECPNSQENLAIACAGFYSTMVGFVFVESGKMDLDIFVSKGSLTESLL